jgi:hypothetical protein
MSEMQRWAEVIRKASKRLRIAIVAANNHYAGFGPASANAMRTHLGQPEAVWDEMKQAKFDS